MLTKEGKMRKERAAIFVIMLFILFAFSKKVYAEEKQEYRRYQDAVAATMASGNWTENLDMTANMKISDGSTNLKTEFTVTSIMDIWDYDTNNLSAIKMKGSATMQVMNQMYAWNILYENGIAHYEYEKPEQSSVDIEIEPSYFDFNVFTEDMMENERMSGNKIMFTIPGNKMEETGIVAANLISGIDNISYGDIDVETIINDTDGTIDAVKMMFSASLTYQGYDAQVDYQINYDFSKDKDVDVDVSTREEQQETENDNSDNELMDGIVIYSDYNNLSIRKKSAITLGAGSVMNGEMLEDSSGITFSVEDTSIVSVDDTYFSNNLVYVTLNGKNEGTTNVIFSDSDTGYIKKVPVTVYEDNYLSYTLNSVPLQYVEKYPTNVYNFNGLYMDNYSYVVNEDKTASVSFDIYNTNYTYGVVEIYDAEGKIKHAVLIGKMRNNNTSIKNVMLENVGCLARDIKDGDLLSYRQESGFSKCTPVTVKIPKDGYIKISNDPKNSAIVNIINSADILMSLGKLTNEIKNYDVNADVFMEKLTMKLLDEKLFITLIENENNFSDDLWKGVAKKAVFSTKSLGDFSNTIAKNLDELKFGVLIAETALDFGWSIGEEVFTYFTGPIKMVFDGIFAVAKVESIITQHVDLNNSANVGSIYIQNQGGGIRSSQQIRVKSDGDFPEEVSLNVFRVELDSSLLEKMKESNPKVYDRIKKGTSHTYNISLLKQGSETQPEEEVTVYIPIPKDMKLLAYLGKAKIYRVESDGTLTEMDVKTEEDCFVFKTSHFSLYTLVEGEVWKLLAVTAVGILGLCIGGIVYIRMRKQKRKQDRKIEMRNYCGKCGSQINQETGLCPNCDKKQEIKIYRKKRKKKALKIFLVCIALLLIGIGIGVGIIGILSYFGKVDIPVVSDWIEENVVLEDFVEEKFSFIVGEKKDSHKRISTEETTENEQEIWGEMEVTLSDAGKEQEEMQNNTSTFEKEEKQNIDTDIQQTSKRDISNDKLARKNYYDKEGKLIYYESYAYYDNGLLCSVTLHSVSYSSDGSSHVGNGYTLLYVYDENGKLSDTVLGSFEEKVMEEYNESAEEIIIHYIADNAGNYVPVYIHPLEENIDEADIRIDVSRTEEIYEKTLVIPTGIKNTWAKVYLNNIYGEEEPAHVSEWRLIYVDKNEVPELWIDYVGDASGERIYTQNKRRVDEIFFTSGVPLWRDKENLLLVSGGCMENYYDQLYEIQDGKFVLLEEGSWFWSMTDNAIYEGNYYWNGAEVTEEEYYQHIQRFKEEDYKEWNQNVYTYQQFRVLLQTIAG